MAGLLYRARWEKKKFGVRLITELKLTSPTFTFSYLFRYKSWRAGVLPVEREEGGGGGQGTDPEPRGRQPRLHLRPHPTDGGPQVQQ